MADFLMNSIEKRKVKFDGEHGEGSEEIAEDNKW